MSQPACFHCRLPVPAGSQWTRQVDGETRAFCCLACRTVADTILQGGLGDYYRLREQPGNRPGTDDSTAPHPFDHPAFQAQLVERQADGCNSTRLAVEGLHCAACVWLIESRLQQLPGVAEARVQMEQQCLSLHWDPSQRGLGDLARAVEQLGYPLSPWHPEALLALQARERRSSLVRLGIAGIAMMQTGMLAAALYLGDYQDIEPQWRELLRWVSFVFALPVATVSAWPFYRNAANGLRQGMAVMDLPVAIAIAGAFIASFIATVLDSVHVYYDSVVMFTFLLLAGRHIEMVLRHRNRRDSLANHDVLPWQAHRLVDASDGSHHETVPAITLQAGDRVLVKPGETIPVDGVVWQGRSTVNESVITGESRPLPRGPGERVLAGSVNTGQPLLIRASTTQSGSRVAQMRDRLDQALAAKPAITQAADRLAGTFVLAVLVAAGLTLWLAWPLGPDAAFARTLAVLVASCPCALSLATPVALTAATHALARRGLLVTRGHVLETLPQLTHAVFDKTGTLTHGEPVIGETRCTGTLDATTARRVAATLEQASDHPVARAFRGIAPLPAAAVEHHTGAGISGTVDGRAYRIGHADFLQAMAPDRERHWIGLADAQGVQAWFALEDALRADAATAVTALRNGGLAIALLTGDRSGEAQRIGTQLGITDITAAAGPEAKQAHILRMQQAGKRVLMVGDGINDAAVLAAADVSVAVADASSLARLQADAILTRADLGLLQQARDTARQTRRIIHQNLAWATGYNAAVVPLAAFGWIHPWLAALGMSLSSLLVVANATRLARRP